MSKKKKVIIGIAAGALAVILIADAVLLALSK